MGSVQWKCDTGFGDLFPCHPQIQQKPRKAVGREATDGKEVRQIRDEFHGC